jgi:AraC-like DNA-binding protein
MNGLVLCKTTLAEREKRASHRLIIIISFFVAMKVDLALPAAAEGFANLLSAPIIGIPSHRHEELEMNLVLSGKAAYLMGEERVPLVPGSMIWLFPRQEHVLIDCSHDFSIWVLVFKQGLVKRLSHESRRGVLRSQDPGSVLCRQIDPPTTDAFHAAYQRAACGDGDRELANAALAYAFVASWQEFQSSPQSIPSTDVHPAIARAARLISDADSAVPLPELARQSGLSAARLSRLFKRQTGVSLTSFRQRKFLERFLRIYRTGARYTLIEAAFLAGFGSYPQFHRVFTRYMGRSPSSYFNEQA